MNSVLSAYQDSIQTLTLCNPSKKNAMTSAMYAQLTEELKKAAMDPDIVAVMLTGAEGNFCAGHDLNEFQQQKVSNQDALEFLLTLSEFPKPLLAAVKGAAVGVGATMLLHCDLVVCAEHAHFQFPFNQLGLVPEAASSLLLPHRVGDAKAAEWLMLGEPFNAHQALLAGFINFLVPLEELESKAQQVAEQLAQSPSQSLQATKALMKAPLRKAIRKAIRQELELFQIQLESEECQRALEEFFQTRSSTTL